MPKVTVAMPAYNDAPYIAEAINSILNQSFTDFKLLIINDGSTDDTTSVIDSFSDHRIEVINLTENKGRPYVRNMALAKAQSKYLVWMDSDDISPIDRLQIQTRFLDEHPNIDLCGGYMQCFGQSNHLVRVKTSPEAIKAGIILYSSTLNGTNCMRLKSIHDNALCYREDLLRAEDYAFFGEALLSTSIHASNIAHNFLHCRYFKRKSNPMYHAKAAKYILQALNLPYDELSCYKHTILSIGLHNEFPKLDPMDILTWANELYEVVMQREDIVTDHFLRVCHSKVENFLKQVKEPHATLRMYASLKLAKTHNLSKLFNLYSNFN